MGFPDRLRSLRHKEGMTQHDLADRLGVTAQAVSNWESGKATPGGSRLKAIAGVFGVPVDDIVADDAHDDEGAGEVVIYRSAEGEPAIDVRFEGETVWLTQQQVADLFQTSRTNIVEHIGNIYDEGELDVQSTCRDFRQVRIEGSRDVSREVPHYNLDMIISRQTSVEAGLFSFLAGAPTYAGEG